ncbi:MAG: DUF3997 domain-containing protein [Cyclobacteriaceae bacterium]
MRKIFFLMLVVNCSGLAIKEKVIGNYYLVAADDGAGCILSYHEGDEYNYDGIIEATVFAVGWNNKFIIAKQHPRTFPHPPNKNITNYFILSINEKSDQKNGEALFGPLTLEQFNVKRKKLGVPDDLEFTKVFKDLE